jgi:hypothetical protein
MTDNSETVGRMRRANPVPDPASLHADTDDAAVLFASIEQRRNVAALPTMDKAMTSREQVNPPLFHRPFAVAIGAGVAVIALVAPVVLMSRSEPGIPAAPTATAIVTTTAIPSTTVPQTSPATTVAPPPAEPVIPAALAMTWERVPTDAVLERAWMRAVTAGGPGLVAVGSTEEFAAAVWTSEDGVEWQRIESPTFGVPESVREGTSYSERFMSAVVGGPSGLVATGGQLLRLDNGNAGYIETIEAVVWHSPDGLEWTEVGGNAFAGATINAVAVGGPGYIAVGATVEDGQPAVWASVDGREWERVSDESLAPGADYISAELNDVVAGGPGLVAVGCEYPTEDKFESWERWHPGIWVSADGRAWNRLPDDAVVDPDNVPAGIPTCPASVAAGDDGLFGPGASGDQVWLSTDGYQWTISQSFVPSWNMTMPFVTRVATNGSRVIGAGTGLSMENPGSSMQPPHYIIATFLSLEADTGTWYRVAQFEAIDRTGMIPTGNWDWNSRGVVGDVVAFGDGFVAVGHSGVYDTEPNEELDWNWCGFEDEWTGSCRTDAAVWVGTWTNENRG